MAEKKEKLFEQFPPVSAAEWRAKVEADLKGAPFDKKLVWRTNEGFNVQPMYRMEDIEDFATTNSLPGEFLISVAHVPTMTGKCVRRLLQRPPKRLTV